MTWESLKTDFFFDEILGVIERDWPDHDYVVQRVARDRANMCGKHRRQDGDDYYAAIFPPEFVDSRGKDGDRFVGFGPTRLEAIKAAYSNFINLVPDEHWRNARVRRRGRKK